MLLSQKRIKAFISIFFFFEFINVVWGCGSTPSRLLGKIINGNTAVAHSWPWQVSLREIYGPNSYSTHFCGGSIIDENTIVTAAHCVLPPTASQLAVFVGIHDSSSTPPDSNIYTVSAIYSHPDYDGTSIRNDVAVIKLANPITFTDEVSAVCLPSANSHDSLYDRDVVATGWGVTQDGNLATNLQQANLKVLSDLAFCSMVSNFVSSEQYCVIEDNISPDTNVCSGDSGGPLVYFDGSKWTLYGITSYVLTNPDDSCDATKPSYFSSVPHYLEFLNPNGDSLATDLKVISSYLYLASIGLCLYSINLI